MAPQPDTPTERGFSLLELLVVTAGFGLLVGGLVQVLGTGQSVYHREANRVTAAQRSRLVGSALQERLRNMGFNLKTVPETLLDAGASFMTFAGDIDNGGPEAPCDATLEAQPDAGVERVTLQLLGSEIRQQVDCWTGNQWQAGSSQPLTAGVARLQFRYFDAEGVELAGSGNPGRLNKQQRADVRSIAFELDLTSANAVDSVTYTLSGVVILRNAGT